MTEASSGGGFRRLGQCIPGNHNRTAATAKTGIINSRPTTTTTIGSGNKSERPTHILNDDNQLNFRQKATAAKKKKTEHTHTHTHNSNKSPKPSLCFGASVRQCVCFLSHSLVPPPPDTHHGLAPCSQHSTHLKSNLSEAHRISRANSFAYFIFRI